MVDTFNTGNSIDDQHLDAIKAVKEGRANKQELNLEDNAPKYFRLYKKGMDEDQLTLQVINKWNQENKTDYFGDKPQIQKARSYARNILEFFGPEKEKEAPEEKKSFKEKRKELQDRTGLSEEERTKEEEKLIDEQIREKAAKDLENEKEKKDDNKNPNKKSKYKDAHEKALYEALGIVPIEDDVKKIDSIRTVGLPRIPLPNFEGTSTNQNGVKETKISVSIMRLSYRAWLRHHRINRVARRFNKIGDDPTKGLNYIAAMCKKREGGRAMAAMLRGGRTWLEKQDIARSPKVFRQKIEKQKQEFIYDITEGVERAGEKDIIAAVKTRIDYFAQQYYIRTIADLGKEAKKINPDESKKK